MWRPSSVVKTLQTAWELLPPIAQGITLAVATCSLDALAAPARVWFRHSYPNVPFVVHQDFMVAAQSTIVVVAVTLLGLYFAAISVVASTAYRGLYVAARAVLLEDSKPRALLGSLARLAAYGTVVFFAQIVGVKIGMLSAAILLTLTLVGLIAFMSIAPAVLDYLDPTSRSSESRSTL